MKKVLILLVAMLLVAGVAYGASIVSSDHDMRDFIADETTTQVCVFCHTPHQASAATSQDPLWNKTMTATVAFGVYASSTLDASPVPADIGGQAPGSQSVSALCMGCHDGTVAVNSLYKQPKDGSAGTATFVSGSELLGTDLSDDHPINFTYDAALVTADGGLNDPTALSNVVLFSGQVQCASCHNVHDPANSPFLRVSNSGSALCLECHNK